MNRKEYINFTRTNNEPINMKNPEIARWMDEMAIESQSQLVKLNQLSDKAKILKQFEILTDQKLDESFRCFLPFYTDYGKNIQIGKNVFINKNCNFQDRGGIEIHDGALIGMNVTIATLNHGIKPNERHIIYPQRVVIGKNAWIGSGVTILPGVTIGENTIIAAGAILTKNAEENSIYAGVPAKKIKNL
ncbi:acetyltransferase [Mesoplasma coleopterae]|uniref:acyltransferase n=1 Tax=Mesoplasma coleopterae TaxID=324078 RepID=UPI000D03563E|nr:DapH/DapD/GlmU-related protein [Mesoplasma coleopterae]AVN62093.1 acetyltransferase [Mesoplasma coleopterae]